MKNWLFPLILCLGAICGAKAQPSSITVDLAADQEQYLPGEDIKIAVRITNRSGQELELGTDNSWLVFSVESREKRIVESYSRPEVVGAFKLASSTTGTKRVNIAPHFDMQSPGRYQVTARIRVPQWNIEVPSRPLTVDVMKGSKVHLVEFGVPVIEGEPARAPEVRKYILQKAELRNEMRLYLRLTDAYEGKTFKLFPISRTMSFSRPEMHLDKFSNAHVLHQSGQNSFTYCTMNPWGQILNLQRYDYYGQSRPRLAMNDDGRVVVRGGTRVITERDLPPSEETAAVDAPTP